MDNESPSNQPPAKRPSRPSGSGSRRSWKKSDDSSSDRFSDSSENSESKVPAPTRPFDRKNKSRGDGKKPNNNFLKWSGRFIVMAIITIAPWSFGSVSQVDQATLFGLGIVGLAIWWFSMAFGNRNQYTIPFLALPVILGVAYIGFQMVPLPGIVSRFVAPTQATLYSQFATPVADELLEQADNPSKTTVRVTMDVDRTAKVFNQLMLALICLLLGCHFFESRRSIFILPLIATLNGTFISFYGILQRLRGANSIFGIELTQGGSPFGPFVNRNNASGYLLMCLACAIALMYGAFNRKPAAGQRPRKIVTNDYPIWQRIYLHAGLFFAELNAVRLLSMLGTFVILLGIVFTFSRGGIVAMGIGLTVTAWYYCLAHRSASILIGLFITGLLVVGLIGYAGFGSQLTSKIESLSNTELPSTDKRIQHWMQTSEAIGDFAPMGSGVGSYVNVHRLYRSDSETSLYYFAENQYFQSLVEAGFIGLLLLISAIVILSLSVRFIAAKGNSPKTAALSLLGIFLITSQVLAAAVDFGLFIPSNTFLMATLSGFLAGQAHALADRLKKESNFRFKLKQSLTMSILLVVFAAALLSFLSNVRYAKVEEAVGERHAWCGLIKGVAQSPTIESYLTLNLEQTNERIEKLTKSLAGQPDAVGLSRLAELYMYRMRIQIYDLLGAAKIKAASNESDSMWNSTSISRLHNDIYRAWDSGNLERVKRLINDPLVRENLLPAVYYLKRARSRSPLEPTTHLKLGQLHSVGTEKDSERVHLERSMKLAPGNSATMFICGKLSLQAGRMDDACRYLRMCLLIEPKNYKRVTYEASRFLPAERIVNEVLPEDPLILYEYARTWLTLKSSEPLKLDVFKRVEGLLSKQEKWDRKSLAAKAEVQKGLGDIDGAIKTVRQSVTEFPEVLSIRHRLVHLLIFNKQLDEAMTEVKILLERDRENPGYQQLKSQIQILRNERDFPNQ